MKSKWLVTVLVLSAFAVLVMASTMNVVAQGPVNTFPGNALYLDNQWHTIPAKSELWYLFDYSGDNSFVELVLIDGLPKRLEFSVYTPDSIRFPDQVGTPIGRGSAPYLPCDTGKCQSNNLIWKGSFRGPGTFFVQVINNNSDPIAFGLGIAGSAVTLKANVPQATATPQASATPTVNYWPTVVAAAVATLRSPVTATVQVTATAQVTASVPITQSVTPTPYCICVTPTPLSTPTTPVATPSTPTPTTVAVVLPTAVPTPLNDWWSSAIFVVNGQKYVIGPTSERWYVFDYAGDRTKIDIIMPGGFENKLSMKIYTSELARRYEADGKSIGEALPPTVNCDQGKCQSNDLVWSGDFPAAGVYFIQVTNSTSIWKGFQINVTGSGVTTGR